MEKSEPQRHDLTDILAQLDGLDGQANNLESSAPASSKPESAAPSRAPRSVGDRLTDPRDLERPSLASGIVVEVGDGIKFDPSFATFGQRTVGVVVDSLILTLAVLPGLALLLIGDSVAVALLAVLVMLIGFILVVVLASRAIAANGKWVGNRVAGTTVVDAINGSTIDGGRAALRLLGRHLISPILLIGFIVALTDGQRRTFHDRLAGSVVIRRQREVWTSDDD